MAALKQKIDKEKILATARAHVAGHVCREDRVAAVLKTAYDNIVKLDPAKIGAVRVLLPLQQEMQQRQAATARREQFRRTLATAHDTLASLTESDGRVVCREDSCIWQDSFFSMRRG